MGTSERNIKIVAPGQGKTLNVVGDTLTCKAMGGDTGGMYSLYEDSTPP